MASNKDGVEVSLPVPSTEENVRPFHDLTKVQKDEVWQIAKRLALMSHVPLPKSGQLFKTWLQTIAITYRVCGLDYTFTLREYTSAFRVHKLRSLTFNSPRSLDWLLKHDVDGLEYLEQKRQDEGELHQQFAVAREKAQEEELSKLRKRDKETRQKLDEYFRNLVEIELEEPDVFKKLLEEIPDLGDRYALWLSGGVE